MEHKNILIVGLGLLGASLGMALRGKPCRRLGWARRAETRTEAVACGAIDETGDSLPELMLRADLTVLALPIPATIRFLKEHAADWRAGSVVTDVGSVKSEIVRAAQVALAGRDVAFVGSHPMAGTEKSGLRNAFPALYDNAEVFVCAPEGTSPEAAAMVKMLWSAIGTRVVEIDAEAHDRLVAHTSHVLHIVASSLALGVLGAEDEAECGRRFSGCATGFRDTSRIASSNPVMWREIIEHNRSAVLAAMRDFDVWYGKYREMIEQGDFDEFEQVFREGKRLRDAWVKYKEVSK